MTQLELYKRKIKNEIKRGLHPKRIFVTDNNGKLERKKVRFVKTVVNPRKKGEKVKTKTVIHFKMKRTFRTESTIDVFAAAWSLENPNEG